MNVDSDFEYFKILHSDIKPVLIYKLSNDNAYNTTINIIAKIWSRSVYIEDKYCPYCGAVYQDFTSHIIATCLISSDIRETLYNDICLITNRDFLNCISILNEKETLLKMLGANIPPFVNETAFIPFTKRCFKYVIDCYQYYKSML